jgi:hypothetical protein
VHRFTVKSAGRELKLRASNASDYQLWIAAIKPFAASFEEDEEMSMRSERAMSTAQFDDDDDSDD